MKIQHRITILFTALTASIILLLSGFVYYFASQNSFEDFYKRLDIRAVVAARVMLTANAQDNAAYAELRQAHLEKLPLEKEYFLRLNENGSVNKPAELSLPQSFYEEVRDKGSAIERKGDIFFRGILYKTGNDSYIVIVSALNEFSNTFLGNLFNLLLTGFFVSILLVLTAGILFSRYILKPVKMITAKAEDISTHNLHLRMDVGAGKDEIADLAITFNNMLDRLETAFETQNNFISNASHELNTPLTSIIGEAELTLKKPRTPLAYTEALKIILAQADRLQSIVTSLLNLARTGFHNSSLQLKQVIRVDELVWQVIESMQQVHPECRINFDISLLPEEHTKLKVNGNGQLLHLALNNIVSNACKYSNNEMVDIALAASDKTVIIVVKDQGIGIPNEELKYIYDPFFRASNTISFRGYGIGLPLARNIIRMHKGQLTVASEVGKGTVVEVRLPSIAALPVT